MVSNEHPEILERLVPDPALKDRVSHGATMLEQASVMRVTSAAGTDLTIDVSHAVAAGSWGLTDGPGTIAHWPGGLCLCFPPGGHRQRHPGARHRRREPHVQALSGVVGQAADHRRLRDRHLGDGLDAELMSSYMEAWDDPDAYAVSHVGWGMNPAARWDALTMYDRTQFNGTELRAFAGNFLYSTGANETAGRHTLGHFDLPMRNCTITLDDRTVVSAGRVAF